MTPIEHGVSTTSPRTTAAARFELYLVGGLQHPTHRLAGFGGLGAPPCQHPSDPAKALITDRVAMAGLPPVASTTGTTVSTRLGRDYYVAMASSANSVHPEAIGWTITVTAGLDRVRAHCGDRLVGNYERHWGASGLVFDPEARPCSIGVATTVSPPRTSRERHLAVDVQVVDLSAYDSVFGTGQVA